MSLLGLSARSCLTSCTPKREEQEEQQQQQLEKNEKSEKKSPEKYYKILGERNALEALRRRGGAGRALAGCGRDNQVGNGMPR